MNRSFVFTPYECQVLRRALRLQVTDSLNGPESRVLLERLNRGERAEPEVEPRKRRKRGSLLDALGLAHHVAPPTSR